MKKCELRSLFVCTIVTLLYNLTAPAGELFPPGRFDWPADKCEVNDGIKKGKYHCGLFLDTGDEKKRQFIFWSDCKIPDVDNWSPKISLDEENVLRDAKVSLKFDFEKIDTKILHRPSFLLPQTKMEKGTTYEATVYIRSAAPDMKIRIALMGNYKEIGKTRNRGIYKFYKFNTSTMWRPFTVRLNTKIRRNLEEATLKNLSIQADSPGIFWIGKIEIKTVSSTNPAPKSAKK